MAPEPGPELPCQKHQKVIQYSLSSWLQGDQRAGHAQQQLLLLAVQGLLQRLPVCRAAVALLPSRHTDALLRECHQLGTQEGKLGCPGEVVQGADRAVEAHMQEAHAAALPAAAAAAAVPCCIYMPTGLHTLHLLLLLHCCPQKRNMPIDQQQIESVITAEDDAASDVLQTIYAFINSDAYR